MLHLSIALLPLSSFASLPPSVLFNFILYLIMVYISMINLFIVQTHGFFLFLCFWFSSSSSWGGKWRKGYVVLSCWLGLHSGMQKLCSLFSYSAKLWCLSCFQPSWEPWNMRQKKASGKNLQILIVHPVLFILWMGSEADLQWSLLSKKQNKTQAQNISKIKTSVADVIFSLITDLFPGSPLSLIQGKSWNATS